MAVRRLTAEQRAKIFKALADPKRVDIVDALVGGAPMCGTALADALGVSLSLACHHWEVLVEAGVLKKERVGQLRVCTVDVERIREALGGWGLVEPAAAGAAPPPAGEAPRASARPGRAAGAKAPAAKARPGQAGAKAPAAKARPGQAAAKAPAAGPGGRPRRRADQAAS